MSELFLEWRLGKLLLNTGVMDVQEELFDHKQAAEDDLAALESLESIRFPWHVPEQRKGQKATQVGLFSDMDVRVDRFHSGATAIWDFRGFAMAGVPVGITAAEIAMKSVGRMTELVDDYTSKGGLVFVDSGAFGAFVSQTALNFELQVFPIYDELSSKCKKPENLRLVMPDLIGNPSGTMALHREHREKIRAWMATGAQCIFPLHSSTDELFMSTIDEIAEGKPYAVGVPSNKAAWSAAELIAFCEAHQPKHLHLLGLAREERVQALASEIVRVSPETSISCDSCTILQHAGVNRRLTDRSRSRLADAISWIETDPAAEVPLPDLSTFMTDVLYTRNHLDEKALTLIAKKFGVSLEALQAASESAGLSEVLCPLDPDEVWLHSSLSALVRDEIYRPWLEKLLRGPIRSWEVARLAGMADTEIGESEVTDEII